MINIELILKFFIYSVLGCMLEVAWGFLIHKQIKSRRMLLTLPMCPVYGIGGVVMSVFLSGFRDSLILLYSFGALLASAVELAYFLIFSQRFGIMAWDYSRRKANFMGGVCGEYTLLWGVLAIVFVRYVDPFVSRILAAQSDYGKLVAAVFLALIMLSDTKNTAEVLSAFGKGDTKQLPDCFWYMQRRSS